MGQLTALKVKSLTAPGRYSDGQGLMLLVKPSGTRSWLLRIQHAGKRRDIGLGSLNDVGLAEARERAADLRKASRGGVDPLFAKRAAMRGPSTVPTFREAAERVHEAEAKAWKNPKHREQWISSLRRFTFRTLGDTPVDQIEPKAIIEVLLPIWLHTPETAKRVKQRIGTVLDWAFSQGHRSSEAPMRAISRGLPKQPKRDGHFKALAYASVPRLVEALSQPTETTGKLALRFLILTAARSGEVRGALWEEIDWREETWVIPAHRMKAGKEHVVPLSADAMSILSQLSAATRPTSGLIFPGLRGQLSDMTLTKALKAANIAPSTVHGLRSSFRDWAAEQTSVAGEIVEAALAHSNSNKVEAAYRRTNYLDKRRKLMNAWAAYIRSGIEILERDRKAAEVRAAKSALLSKDYSPLFSRPIPRG